uniref:Guanylate cyclase domain-containing protein n=1 Tax=Thermosporothrix sp. COM3 TaxID=2490863 RepID=A0A455SKR6_9CHLR|nr:hypothetical protein KTC_30670 [Thermosporothrix sp. COM3]
MTQIGRVGQDLRAISDELMRISQLLHQHTMRLETDVEGKYASDTGDPRVGLLVDALNIERRADIELGRLSHALQQILRSMPGTGGLSNGQSGAVAFERERAVLRSSISTLKKERDEQGILADIARTLNSTLELDEVLKLVMDRVIEFVDAERGYLMLVSPESGEPEFTIARDKEKYTIPESEFAEAQISKGTVMQVIRTREPLLGRDAALDQLSQIHESIVSLGIRSIMCAPLIVRNHCIGAVYVDSRITANLFSERHLDLLLAFCNQAAIAIDNARLFADLNKAIQQVKNDKQYMDNIFRSIANGVITTDKQGYITTFNSAAGYILNISSKNMIGKHYGEAFMALPRQLGLIPLFRNALENYHLHEHGTFVPSSVECTIPGRRPERISLNFYISSLRDTEGKHIGAALVIDDRTELKRSEEQRKRIRQMFERYVHPNVVQQLIQNPNALKLGGETKEISVLFADIRGFTRLSEGMAPDDVMNMLNRYHKIMCESIWEEEGTLTAFLGDALMAIFNAPLPQSDHALRAVRAAWKMRLAVQQYQQEHPHERNVAFGIGVNTGQATVGNVGAQERLQNYTAIGDAVNVASRLQTNATDNNILINDTTYAQVAPYVNTGQAFALGVKNKSHPLIVRYLLGVL